MEIYQRQASNGSDAACRALFPFLIYHPQKERKKEEAEWICRDYESFQCLSRKGFGAERRKI